MSRAPGVDASIPGSYRLRRGTEAPFHPAIPTPAGLTHIGLVEPGRSGGATRPRPGFRTSDPQEEPIPHPHPTDGVPPPPEPTRIRSVSVAGPRGEKARVSFEDGVELQLDSETLLREGLRPGDPVDAQLRARLVEASLRWRIREAALRLLAHRARSRRELERRLRRKDFPSGLVRPVLDELEARGWLDDAEFARSWIRDRLRLRPRGRRALLAELLKKGVDAAVAEAALDEVFGQAEVSEQEVAFSLAESWVRRQPPDLVRALIHGGPDPLAEKARRRFHGHLGRRGIPGGLIRQALDRLRSEGPDEPSPPPTPGVGGG